MSRHVMSCPGPGFQSSILSVYHLEPYSYWHFKIIFDLWKWCIAAPDFSISAFRPWKVETFHGEPETKERKIITQLVNLFEPRLMVLDKRGTPKLPIRKRISFAMGSWTMDMFYLSLAGWELFVMDIPDTPCRSKYGWVLYSSSAVDTSNISLSRWRLFLQIDMIWHFGHANLKARIHCFMSDRRPLTLLDQAGMPENHLDLLWNECVHKWIWQIGKFPQPVLDRASPIHPRPGCHWCWLQW